MDFINKHYHEAMQNRTQSGNHKPFYVVTVQTVLTFCYNYNNMTEYGVTVLGSLACPKLLEDAKRSSLEDRD
jgi:hypothetical protein